jgi:Zn-dependent protease
MSETIPLSTEAENIIRYAYQLAQDYQHSILFPEHLLLSISAYQSYRSHQLLTSLGVNLEDIANLCQISIAKQIALIGNTGSEKPQISSGFQQALQEGSRVATENQKSFVDTSYVMLGLLKPGLDTAVILKQHGITAEKVQTLLLHEDGFPVESPSAPEKTVERRPPIQQTNSFQVSVVFLVLVGITIFAGLSTYFEWFSTAISVFLFVTGGWVVSLCLHEFGHAVVAYWAGDYTVVEKGYLTLNPLKYTHGLMSIVFPIIIVIMGGIGLPGGAVYINQSLIRHRYQHSLVAAAGPVATGICALLLSLPFLLGIDVSTHYPFWSGMAMLAFLQITALFFNLMPLPGLDGFGILAPYLPAEILRLAYSFGQLTIILIFFLFFYNDAFREWFWGNIFQIALLLGVDPLLFLAGFQLFRFWQQ